MHDTSYFRDSAVKRRCKELNLMGSRVTTSTIPYDEALQHILAEMDADISNSRGLANVKSRIAYNKLTHLSRDFISEVMPAFDSEGFDNREYWTIQKRLRPRLRYKFCSVYLFKNT